MENHLNPDIAKQAQDVIFSQKTVQPFHPKSSLMKSAVSRKHLGLNLDQKFDFHKHINEKISKA